MPEQAQHNKARRVWKALDWRLRNVFARRDGSRLPGMKLTLPVFLPFRALAVLMNTLCFIFSVVVAVRK